MFDEIDGSDQWLKIERIEKGWSDDDKYYIETRDQQKLALRVASIDKYEAKKREFEVICKYADMGIDMSNPIAFGTCSDDQMVYMLLTWVEGKSLEEALPKLDEEVQYALGREAGTILKKIHSTPLSDGETPEHTKLAKKKAQIESYKNSKVRITNDSAALKYIDEHLHKIWSEPPVYLHGDFHPGNLILTPEGKIGVIDFNRWAIGDPYEEFYKLDSFGVEVSIPYCRGQIDGYFNDKVPQLFWEILAVYVAHASLYSIKWAEKFGREEIDKMLRRCEASFDYFNGFKRCIPSWYDSTL